MPKYVNADKIISHLNEEIEACGDCDVCFRPVTYGTRLGLEYSKSLVETAETADVQEVIRCKDCKYFYQDSNIKVCKHWNCHSTTDGAYCSYGERRKEDAKIF